MKRIFNLKVLSIVVLMVGMFFLFCTLERYVDWFLLVAMLILADVNGYRRGFDQMYETHLQWKQIMEIRELQ